MSGLTSLKIVAVVSSISTTCQGIAWSVISLMAILCYACTIKPDPITKTTQLSYVHYLAAYFQGNCEADLEIYKDIPGVTSSEKLLIIEIFLYSFNLLLTVAGIINLFALSTNKRHLILGWLLFYIIVGFCVSIIDVVATAFVASDYDYISNYPKLTNRGMAGLTLLSVLLIVTRGVFLWVANNVFFLYLTACLCKISCKQDGPGREETSPSPARTDISFNFNRNEMERPIEYLDKREERKGHEYPEHSAYSRWPKLHPGNRLQGKNVPAPQQRSRATTSQHIPVSQQQPKLLAFQKPPLSRQIAHRELQSYYHPKPIPQTSQSQPNVQSVGSDSRPGSLQEAILTVRPLRQIRPRLAQMPESYP